LWLAFTLRLGEFYDPFLYISDKDIVFYKTSLFLFIISPIVALPFFIYGNLYKLIIRFFNSRSFKKILLITLTYSSIWGVVAIGLDSYQFPRSVVIINALIVFLLLYFSRFTMRFILELNEINFFSKNPNIYKNVLIYGAGKAGRNLLEKISENRKRNVIAFIDDDPLLHDRYYEGIKIISSKNVEDYINYYKINEILLAIPSVEKSVRKKILENLKNFSIQVKTLPSLEDVLSGRKNISDIEDLDIDDLLGREALVFDQKLIAKEHQNKVILISGAGGSIGSEISRQCLNLKPKYLILYEQNEFSLYSIHKELEEFLKSDKNNIPTIIIPILGSICNERTLQKVFTQWNPQIVYHAAAYKHVPMVEHNIIEGVKNNSLGTLTLAKISIKFNVNNFILISTDKAVRPTNIMGVSKRLAEMILQALANEKNIKMSLKEEKSQLFANKTNFTMVRFGNVLGSSGSVVPLFRKQIESGGPITLTHKEVTRYFMTIPEATHLVMHALLLSKSKKEFRSNLYILEMGKPVKIINLARRMIKLSGLKEKKTFDDKGDIEIKITGLRPGEKIFEELLIDNSASKTSNPRIFEGHESFQKWEILESLIKELALNIKDCNLTEVIRILKVIVPEYQPSSSIVDWVYLSEKRKL